MQFVNLVSKIDSRASKDYDRNKADLPSRSFGAVTMNVWIQLQGPGYPGSKKTIKPKNSDYKAAKLEIMFGNK